MRLHFLPGDRNARIAVRDVVGEFSGEVRRADRHHNRIGPQDRIQRDDEMRAVLQVDEHAVARPHAADSLQITGQGFGLAKDLRDNSAYCPGNAGAACPARGEQNPPERRAA